MDKRIEFRVLLLRNRITFADIARKAGVTRGHAQNVFSGRFASRPVVEAASQLLGIPADEIVERYIPKFRLVAA